MANFDEKTLIEKFKLTIGDLTSQTDDLNKYYENFLSMAAAELRANDISETILASELGGCAVVLYAKAKMEGVDTATDKTCIFLRNTLSIQTKGERRGSDGD